MNDWGLLFQVGALCFSCFTMGYVIATNKGMEEKEKLMQMFRESGGKQK